MTRVEETAKAISKKLGVEILPSQLHLKKTEGSTKITIHTYSIDGRNETVKSYYKNREDETLFKSRIFDKIKIRGGVQWNKSHYSQEKNLKVLSGVW